MTRIAIVQGHPDPSCDHFCHAFASAYAEGAAEGGHEVRVIAVAALDFPLLRSKADWESGAPPPAIAEAQADLAWAGHLVIIHPLWLGGMPAILKGFLEQALRPTFLTQRHPAARSTQALGGRSARLVVTMGMPALVYRWYFGAPEVRSLKRGILGLVGVRPRRHTLIGRIETMSGQSRRSWLDRARRLGRRAR